MLPNCCFSRERLTKWLLTYSGTLCPPLWGRNSHSIEILAAFVACYYPAQPRPCCTAVAPSGWLAVCFELEFLSEGLDCSLARNKPTNAACSLRCHICQNSECWHSVTWEAAVDLDSDQELLAFMINVLCFCLILVVILSLVTAGTSKSLSILMKIKWK